MVYIELMLVFSLYANGFEFEIDNIAKFNMAEIGSWSKVQHYFCGGAFKTLKFRHFS